MDIKTRYVDVDCSMIFTELYESPTEWSLQAKVNIRGTIKYLNHALSAYTEQDFIGLYHRVWVSPWLTALQRDYSNEWVSGKKRDGRWIIEFSNERITLLC